MRKGPHRCGKAHGHVHGDAAPGNGVGRIYKTLETEDLLYTTSTPLVGDIIFWDNTWDANGDGTITEDEYVNQARRATMR